MHQPFRAMLKLRLLCECDKLKWNLMFFFGMIGNGCLDVLLFDDQFGDC